jgi:hypothetical protein
MKKGQGSVRAPHFTEEVLSRTIAVDGKNIIASKATAEEFDIYVFNVLAQMYEKQHFLLKCYNETFGYDYAYPMYRVIALNELHRLNLARRSTVPPKPKIPLFVEEEQAHV